MAVLRFSAPALLGLRDKRDVHIRLTGKRVGDFLSVLTELYSLGVTPEALREKID